MTENRREVISPLALPCHTAKILETKYVNERNTSCKSEGTSKAKASYLQLDIVPVETKMEKKKTAAASPTGREKKRWQGTREEKEGGGGRMGRETREALEQLLIRLGGSPRLKTFGRGFEQRFRGLKRKSFSGFGNARSIKLDWQH